MALTTSSVNYPSGYDPSDPPTLPSSHFAGHKTNISSSATSFCASQEIKIGVLVRIDSLGGGTYIAFGNSSYQYLKLISVDSYIFIDWIDNLTKIYVKSDGTNAEISWIGA